MEMEYIVQAVDVGKTRKVLQCEACGARLPGNVFEPLGRVLEKDVGKKCRLVKGNWFVENQEQFEARLKREADDWGVEK